MDLFDYAMKEQLKKDAPLADRMRPRTLDQFVGQSHILSPGKLLRRAIQADQLSSLIFFGPPGTGKTTLARIIANTTKAEFISLNAVLSGVKDIRESISIAETSRQQFERKTILFIDEVHRFNKSQQDALLPHVENGTVILIGATTENPYFEVNKALVSRSRIFQLESLQKPDLEEILKMALSDKERGYGDRNITVSEDASNHLSSVANGDARAVLNALELAVETSQPDDKGIVQIDLEIAEESIQKKAVLYDKDGDAHFDTISAFIKSMRGSDPDAALYWMAKMVYGGEDPRFLFRRMIIFAGEDVGMADPNALQVVVNAARAFDYVGMPEGRFHLAEACLYLSTAPKSNSGFAFFDALNSVQKERSGEVPDHIKDGNRDKEELGHGKDYLYPHAYKDHWVAQQYLPDGMQGRLFYQPSNQGYEAKIRDEVNRRRELQQASFLNNDEATSSSQENYWQERTFSNTTELAAWLRDQVFSYSPLKRYQTVLVLNAGDGVFLGEAVRTVPEGTVYGMVRSEEDKRFLEQRYENLDYLSKPVLLAMKQAGTDHWDLDLVKKENVKFDQIIGKNSLLKTKDLELALGELGSILTDSGSLMFVESIPGNAQRLSEYLPEESLSDDIRKKLHATEDRIYSAKMGKAQVAIKDSIEKTLESSGFKSIETQQVDFFNKTIISRSRIEDWFSFGGEKRQSYADHLASVFNQDQINQIKRNLMASVGGKTVKWRSNWLFVKAVKQQ